MRKLIVASNNKDKVREIKEILEGLPVEIISLKEAGIDIDVVEDGKTFLENSYKKAAEIYEIAGDNMVLADDSGLAVEFLNGAPGVFSARFAGEHGNSKKNNEKLLSLLEGVPIEQRKGKFVCAMVLIINKDTIIKVEGEVEGYIAETECGNSGFGYDPLFYIPEYNMTFAEMPGDKKNLISHRKKALDKIKNELVSYIENLY